MFRSYKLSKKGDLHWDFIIALIIALLLIFFGVWLVYKSGKFTASVFPSL